MIPDERIMKLNGGGSGTGKYVLYWMQASQRSHWNHALEYAIERANKRSLPVLVYFALTDEFPEANLRHYRFMLEGIKDTASALEKRGIRFLMENNTYPPEGVVRMSKDASLVVVDRGYLRVQKRWRKEVSDKVSCPVIQVESDVVVPVEIASPKEEYTAGTFRPKINKVMGRFLTPVQEVEPKNGSPSVEGDFLDPSDVDGIISQMDIDRSVKPSDEIKGGTTEALKRYGEFLDSYLDRYDEERNDPSKGIQSGMSPYLHFGQISPLFLALEASGRGEGSDSFLEELIVRRELSVNFVHYNGNYDSYQALPGWAKDTLGSHSSDPREYLYSLEDLENSRTHDPYWNAAQKEMVTMGKMHNYMRMYWGKKILEWTEDPGEAFKRALYLNNKYSLDGRDPNSYAGVAWCFGKHDRAWRERPVFGKVRYMNANGLKRKFDIERYAKGILRST